MPHLQCVITTGPEFIVMRAAYQSLVGETVDEMFDGCAMTYGRLVTGKNGVSEWRCDADWPCTQGDPDGKDTQDTPSPLRLEFVADSARDNWFRFQALAEQWRNARGARSSITEAAMIPAYQKIIGMGEAVVPLILAQLKSEGDDPDQWFWALRAITGQNPVKPEDQGNFQKMAEAWLQWAQHEPYVW
jgi:hypothetical protein